MYGGGFVCLSRLVLFCSEHVPREALLSGLVRAVRSDLLCVNCFSSAVVIVLDDCFEHPLVLCVLPSSRYAHDRPW